MKLERPKGNRTTNTGLAGDIDLHDYEAPKAIKRVSKRRRYENLKVIAEWPEGVTEAELDLFEIHLRDVLDEIFKARE